MEQAVAFMIGVSALILGISYLARWQDWSLWLRHLRKQGTPAALLMGYLHLVLGTFIVAFHWKWEGLPLLLTLLGVKAILEGIAYTLLPNCLMAMLAWYEPHHRLLLRIAGVVSIIIALVVLAEWRDAYRGNVPARDSAVARSFGQ
ncbi:MAG: hypothetical protein K8S99_10115 [Planctomycetes bacterium]|nr:hypothetical protein [Planctomycetota bacterium]